MANVKNIQKGTDIMVFVKQDGVYKSIAHATSHTFSMSGETQEVNSKDYGEFGSSTVNKINWEITSENLMTAGRVTVNDVVVTELGKPSPSPSPVLVPSRVSPMHPND